MLIMLGFIYIKNNKDIWERLIEDYARLNLTILSLYNAYIITSWLTKI